ncbi:MAG: hypothetical protein ACRDBO_05240 [Lachnospiraceae bacterium]
MQQYKGHKVIRQSEARLVPPDDTYPDCVCSLILTQCYLFVLEDNYDDTYTEYFFLPLAKIKNMRILSSTADEGAKAELFSGEQGLVAAIITFLGLFSNLYIYHGEGTSTRRKQDYLRIDYLDEWAQQKDVFFIELGTGIKKIIKYWGKQK